MYPLYNTCDYIDKMMYERLSSLKTGSYIKCKTRNVKITIKTHRCVTLLVFRSHFTPFHLHGSGSSGLHCKRIPSELVIAVLKLRSTSPINTEEDNNQMFTQEKRTQPHLNVILN